MRFWNLAFAFLANLLLIAVMPQQKQDFSGLAIFAPEELSLSSQIVPFLRRDTLEDFMITSMSQPTAAEMQNVIININFSEAMSTDELP